VEKSPYCVFDGINLVSCIMNCLNRIKLTGVLYCTLLIRLGGQVYARKDVPTTTPDTIILFFCVLVFVYTLRRRSKLTWKHSIGKFYPTRWRNHQALLLFSTTCFDRWCMVCLSNISHRTKIPIIGSIRG